MTICQSMTKLTLEKSTDDHSDGHVNEHSADEQPDDRKSFQCPVTSAATGERGPMANGGICVAEAAAAPMPPHAGVVVRVDPWSAPIIPSPPPPPCH